MNEMRVEDLEVHPFNLEVYGEPDAGLAENIDNFGLQTPIKVDPNGRILSGARRWTAVKKLGWDTIAAEVPDIDFSSQRAVQLYVLISNAYRKQKTSYQQKREADAYYRLLQEGEVTKDDLRKQAKEVWEGRRTDVGGNEDKPSTLAANAAGLDRRTYQRFQYVTDGLAEDEIRNEEGVGSTQKEKLIKALHEDAAKVKQDQMGAYTAEQAARKRLSEAKREASLNPEQRAEREAEEAVAEVRKKGRAYVAALERLFMDHREYLNGEMALNLAATYREIGGLLSEQLPRGFLANGADEAIEDSNAMEVRSEVVA